MTISGFWIFGFSIDQLGKYQYNQEKKHSEINLAGKVYESGWRAMRAISDFFYKKNFEHTVYSYNLFGVRIEAEIGEPNKLPQVDKTQLIALLEEFGLTDLPEPDYYFIVEVK